MSAKQIAALLNSHMEVDQEQSLSTAFQIAAQHARQSNETDANVLKRLVQKKRDLQARVPGDAMALIPLYHRRARWVVAALAAALFSTVPAHSAEPATEPVPTPEALRSEAFVAAQYSLISAAAAALHRTTARMAAGAGALAELEQQREKKLIDLETIDKQFAALNESTSSTEAQRRDLSTQRAKVRDDVTAIETHIQKEFPAYFDLTRPRALDIAAVQELLNPDEGLVMILVSDDAAYTWAITREAATWSRSVAMRNDELRKKVTALRASMQVDEARGAGRPPPGAKRNTLTPTPAPAGPSGSTDYFDRKLAHEMYQALIAPVESLLTGKKVLLTNVTGPLTGLPLALLVTEAPKGEDSDNFALAETAWLSDRYAMAELPSVSSLNALRCLLIPNANDAHPGCKTVAPSQSYARQRSATTTLAGYGAPTLVGSGEDRAALPDLAGKMYKDNLADPEKLRRLAYLPATKIELEAVSKAFGDKALVLTGDASTETAVKASTALTGARFIMFSTHGLIATEVGSNAEPGLVFTPPKAATELDDGLLSSSEAAQLKLTADLVVLSACNTAASDGTPGAEGLSGLARAFFFAGARSLMVSHWSVSDNATSILMTQTFQHIQQGDVADRARALQTAMKEVRMLDGFEFANPVYWAAFTLVGEPTK